MNQSIPQPPPSSGSGMPSEIVLPSGKFVTFRRPTLLDFLAVIGAPTREGVSTAQALMLARIATVDGKALTLDEWLEMDAEESWPAYATSVRIFQHINKNVSGVA